ncbi:alcohol acetyltransferase [Aspergillus venezuelensis]
MAADVEKFERLRDVGSSEKYSTARHPLRFYMNVAVTASYTLPESFGLPLKDYVYKATETLINQHPVLSAIPLREETEEPYWVRLPEVDLSQPITFQKPTQSLTLDEHDSELQKLIETQHDTGFEAPKPYWRLIVLTDGDHETQETTSKQRHFTTVFVYHHALGDGTSGKAFHRTFLQALRNLKSLQQGEAHQTITPPKNPLLPNLELVHPLPTSIPYIAKILFKELVWNKRDPKLWAGGVFQLPLSTYVRFITLNAEQTSRLASVCREHKTTVTCAVETAIARSLFPHIPEQFTRVAGSVPITQRPWLPDIITEDSIGVFVQEHPEMFNRKVVTSNDFPWAETQRVRKNLKKELAKESKDTSVGLFKFVKDYRNGLLQPKIGKERSSTFELSSLGVVKTDKADDEALPQLNRIIFTQSASVTGSAIEFSLITGPDGYLTLGASWQPGVVEEEVIEKIVGTLRDKLQKLSA